MINEEIKQAIETAVTDAVSDLHQRIEELKAPPPAKLTAEEAFQQRMSASVAQRIEDKRTNRYGGKELDSKTSTTLTGAGKDV